MFNIIQALEQGKIPEYHPNPYLRQLTQEDKPKYVLGVQDEWDENVSPWFYFRKYQKDLDKKRKRIEFFINTFAILFFIVGTAYLLWFFFLR